MGVRVEQEGAGEKPGGCCASAGGCCSSAGGCCSSAGGCCSSAGGCCSSPSSFCSSPGSRSLRKRFHAVAPSLYTEAPPAYRASMGRRVLTEQERALLDARDAELTRRFLLHDPAAETEMVLRLDQLGFLVAKRLWPGRAMTWEEFRGAMFEVLARYREEGKLRADESLYFLAQRLMKQAGRKAGTETHRDAAALSLDDRFVVYEPEKKGRGADKLQGAAVAAAAPRFVNPEEAVALKEQVAWVATAASSLAPGERTTFEGVVLVAQDQADTLADALEVSPPAARKRLQRLRAALAAFAAATGATEMLERFQAARRARAVEEKPGAMLLRLIEGTPEPADAEATTESTLPAVDEALEAYLLLPPPPLDVAAAVAAMNRRPAKASGKGKVSRLAAAVVLALVFGWTAYRFFVPAPRPPELPPPAALPAKPAPKAKPQGAPWNHRDMAAPAN
ncbi:MAG: hypothetical protein ACYDCL_12555 [Myxococcales bacterium]